MQISFDIVQNYGHLSDNHKSPELKLVSWNGKKAKYDLRTWFDNGKKPGRGITIEENELPKLLDLLEKATESTKPYQPYKILNIKSECVKILEVYGCFSKDNSWKKIVAYVDWGFGGKYDIRTWSDDYLQCGKGITLNDNEVLRLKILFEAILKDNSNIDEETKKDIDSLGDDLFI